MIVLIALDSMPQIDTGDMEQRNVNTGLLIYEAPNIAAVCNIPAAFFHTADHLV